MATFLFYQILWYFAIQPSLGQFASESYLSELEIQFFPKRRVSLPRIINGGELSCLGERKNFFKPHYYFMYDLKNCIHDTIQLKKFKSTTQNYAGLIFFKKLKSSSILHNNIYFSSFTASQEKIVKFIIQPLENIVKFCSLSLENIAKFMFSKRTLLCQVQKAYFEYWFAQSSLLSVIFSQTIGEFQYIFPATNRWISHYFPMIDRRISWVFFLQVFQFSSHDRWINFIIFSHDRMTKFTNFFFMIDWQIMIFFPCHWS